MTAADRSARQSTADHAGREARIEAVTRDLVADVEHYGEQLTDFRRMATVETQANNRRRKS